MLTDDSSSFYKNGTYFRKRSDIVAVRSYISPEGRYCLAIYFEGATEPMIKEWNQIGDHERFSSALFSWLKKDRVSQSIDASKEN